MQQSLNNSTALGPLTGWWNCLEYDKWCCIVVYWTWYTLLALMLIIKHSTAQSKASLGHFSPKVVLISSYIYIKGIIIRLLYLFLAVSLTSMKYLKKLNVFLFRPDKWAVWRVEVLLYLPFESDTEISLSFGFTKGVNRESEKAVIYKPLKTSGQQKVVTVNP